jgi:hypothetical protein
VSFGKFVDWRQYAAVVKTEAVHQAIKAYWGVEVYLHSFFDLGTRWR